MEQTDNSQKRTKSAGRTSIEARQFLNRLRKEVRGISRRNDKIEALRLKIKAFKTSSGKKSGTEAAGAGPTRPGEEQALSDKVVDSYAIGFGDLLAVKEQEEAAHGDGNEEKESVAGGSLRSGKVLVINAPAADHAKELKELLVEVRRTVDEIKQAAGRVVSSRQLLTLGDKTSVGKIDIVSAHYCKSSRLLSSTDPEIANTLRILLEVMDSLLFELEGKIKAQYKEIDALRADLAKHGV